MTRYLPVLGNVRSDTRVTETRWIRVSRGSYKYVVCASHDRSNIRAWGALFVRRLNRTLQFVYMGKSGRSRLSWLTLYYFIVSEDAQHIIITICMVLRCCMFLSLQAVVHFFGVFRVSSSQQFIFLCLPDYSNLASLYIRDVGNSVSSFRF
jgi:hypothetical protein